MADIKFLLTKLFMTLRPFAPMSSDEDRGEHQFRFPADLRPGEGSDGRDEPRRDSAFGRSLGLHVSPRQIGGRIEATLTDPERKGPPYLTDVAPGRRRSRPLPLAPWPRPRSREIGGAQQEHFAGRVLGVEPDERQMREFMLEPPRARRRPRRRACRRPSGAPAPRSGSGARCRARPFRRRARFVGSAAYSGGKPAIVAAST